MAEVKRYKWEYGNFLEFVKKGEIGHALIYAKALKIKRETLVHWMSQPELREALIAEIHNLTQGMKQAGKDDWRMYREMLKMLGINEEIDHDIKSDGEKMQVATIIDLGNLKSATDQSEAGSSSRDDQEPQS